MYETSASLLARLRLTPNDEDWKRFVALYTPFIQGFLRRRAVPSQDVDDLTQEVLAVVVREVPKFHYGETPGFFRGWLRQIVVNRMGDAWRRRQRQPAAVGGSDFRGLAGQLEDPESALSHVWDQEYNHFIVHHYLELVQPEFTPATVQAFRRCALEGVPAADVAAELGITVNAVHIAKSRVMRRLREELQGLVD